VQANELILHAWYFDLATGIIHAFDSDEQCFLALK
jgi:carbonic anhydrase